MGERGSFEALHCIHRPQILHYQNYEYLILTAEETLENADGLTEKPLRLVHCEAAGDEIRQLCRNEGVRFRVQVENTFFFWMWIPNSLRRTVLEEMLGCCMREKTGIVGARLYDGEKRIVHAGVIIGLHRIAGDAFSGFPKTEEDVYSRILCRQVLQCCNRKMHAGEKEYF